jgi:colanic acid biosynthesis glycosyl transferase WcaI
LNLHFPNRLRLLVIVNVYRPDLGGGVLFADFLEGLAERGFDVEVRCAYPYYPEWRDKTGQNGLAIAASVEHGVRIRRFGLFVPSRPESLWQRLVYEASFFASLLRVLPAPGEFDLVMAYCPLVGGVGYGALAARAAGAPLWLNVQDLAAEAATTAGIVQNRATGSLLARFQRFLFNRASVWSTISPVMQDRLVPLATRGQTVHDLPNWLHGSLADAIGSTERLPGEKRQRRGTAAYLSGTLESAGPHLLYSGNIGGKQDLLGFCKVLADSQAAFRFEIRGDGSAAGPIRKWIRGSGDARFSMAPLTDEAGLAEGLALCDLFVVTEKRDAGGSFIPSKLLPAFGSGTPILAVCDGDSPLGREMHQAQAGPVFDWDHVREIGSLLENTDQLERVLPEWREASRKRGLRYDRERIIDRYAELMAELVSASKPV